MLPEKFSTEEFYPLGDDIFMVEFMSTAVHEIESAETGLLIDHFAALHHLLLYIF